MTGWQDERDREVWWELSQRIRSYHEQCLGEKPRLVRERDGYVLSRAILFRTVTEIETLPYPIEHRAQILEMLVRWARERPGLAIGTIFPGGCRRKRKAGRFICVRPFCRAYWGSEGLTGGFLN